MTISYIGKGTTLKNTSATGNITVSIPAIYQDGDLFILFVETPDQAVDTPGGWTQIPNSPVGSGTGATTGAFRLTMFYKVISGAQSDVVVPYTSGNYFHRFAFVACFRGVDTTTPIHQTASSYETTATASLSCIGLTTTVANAMIVNALCTNKDIDSTTRYTTWTNASLASITEGYEQCYDTQFGGGFAFAYGVKASAGTVSATTTSEGSTAKHGYLTIALNPISASPTGNILKVYNGSIWVSGVLKAWNGSEWVVGKLKQWNGSEWI